MFPIPWNFPFRKKNGDMSTIGDVIGGAGSELPPHGVGDAGKLLGVKPNGSLEWSDAVSSEIQTLTNNLSDEVKTRAKLGAHNIGEYYSNVVISTSSNLPYLVYNSDYTNAICLIAKVEAGKEYVFTKSSTHGDRFRIAGFNSLIFSDTTATGIDIVNNSSLTSYTYKNTANYKYIAFYVNNINTAETLDDVQAMICFASDSDKTYQPYAMTNKELTGILLPLKGYMVQIGSVEIGRAVGLNTAQVTFPRPFADADNTRIWVTYDTSQPNNWIPGRTGVTSTGFTAELYNATESPGSDVSVQWLAIGKQA